MTYSGSSSIYLSATDTVIMMIVMPLVLDDGCKL